MAQGINRQIVLAKQSGLGVPATTGGQVRRRRTGGFQATRDTYANDEIVTHQQSTGDTAGMTKASGKIDGLLSPATYAQEMSAALRKVFAATTAIAAASVTIAALAQPIPSPALPVPSWPTASRSGT